MAKMNTSHRYVYDAAPATLFRARTAAALGATANSAVVVLDTVQGYWNVAGELADETLAVIVNVTALTATGDATINLALKATDKNGVVQADVALGAIKVSKIGQYVFLVDAATAKLVDADFGGLVITATLAGTVAPSVTYHGWMSQIKAA